MREFLSKIFSGQLSSFNENRIYRIFNIIVLLTIAVVLGISLFLLTIEAYSSFLICLGEILFFVLILVLHVKGFHTPVRYVFFIFTIMAQVYGSLYHGENGGFDYYFFVTAIIPVLFFDKKFYFFSLFTLSIGSLIIVKLRYDQVIPIMPFDGKYIFPFYANIVVTGVLLHLGYKLFKSEHLKYEQLLNDQKQEIQFQKEELSVLKGQLEQHLAIRIKKVEDQDKSIKQYAYLNAHKARGPLARILGLINLTKFEDLGNKENRNFYIGELQSNATELDEVLTEITEVLGREVQ